MQVDHVAALSMCFVSLVLLLLLLEQILHTFSAAADAASGGRCAGAGHRVFALHNAQVFAAITSCHPLHLPSTLTFRIQSLCIIALSLLCPSILRINNPGTAMYVSWRAYARLHLTRAQVFASVRARLLAVCDG